MKVWPRNRNITGPLDPSLNSSTWCTCRFLVQLCVVSKNFLTVDGHCLLLWFCYILEKQIANCVSIAYRLRRDQATILCLTSVTIPTRQRTPSTSCLGLHHSSDGRGCPECRIPHEPAVTKCHTESLVSSFSGFNTVGKDLPFCSEQDHSTQLEIPSELPLNTCLFRQPSLSRSDVPDTGRLGDQVTPTLAHPLTSSQE